MEGERRGQGDKIQQSLLEKLAERGPLRKKGKKKEPIADSVP